MDLELEKETERAEAPLIHLRRERAFGTPIPEEKERLPDDVVGLAVSGGGLRSATYNLGFLQALTRFGLLRHVDYLVSVSGGGYTAGHLAALATNVAAETKTNNQNEPTDFHSVANRENLLGIDENERIVATNRFRHVGDYLKEYALFLRMYLLGTIPMLAMFLSGVGLVATALALLWRSLDFSNVREVLGICGISELSADLPFGDETLYAFLPALLCFALLLVAGVIRLGRHWLPSRFAQFIESFSRWSVWLLVVAAAVSLAVVLGNGVSTLHHSVDLKNIQSHFLLPITIITIICLLPLLGAKRILQSGHADAPLWQHRVFQIVSVASSVAIPFFVMYLIARENVSGYANYRPAKLAVDDVMDWKPFLELFDRSQKSRLSEDGPLASEFGSELIQSAESLKESQQKLDEDREDLIGRDPWKRHQSLSVINPINSIGQLLSLTVGSKSQAWREYQQAWSDNRGRQEEFLNKGINSYLSTNVREMDESEEDRQRHFTSRLMQLVAIQATGGTKAPAQPLQLMFRRPVRSEIAANIDFEAGNRAKVQEYVEARAEDMLEGSKIRELWVKATVNRGHEGLDIADAAEEFKFSQRERADFNRLMLELLFPKILRERTQPSTPIVVQHDQQFRWHLFAGFFVVLAITVCLDINRLCPVFGYYNQQIQQYFVATAQVKGDDPEYNPTLSKLAPWESGAPFPIMLASYYLFKKIGKEKPRSSGSQPGDWSRISPFVLTPTRSGSPIFGYYPTRNSGADLTLSEVMAISGSALSPFMVEHLGFAAIMTSLNLRIGHWMKVQPCTPSQGPPSSKVTGFQVLWECAKSFKGKQSKDDIQFALAVDGGFYEFFGLEELLKRRARIILLSDAGCNNGQYEFGSLADVIRLIRERHGIEVFDLDNDVPPDLRILRRDREHNRQPVSSVCLRIRYPADGSYPSREGLLVYSQMSLTGREQLDLQQFRNSNPNFPDEPISNQFFDFRKVESYRQLGYWIGKTLCRSLAQQTGRMPINELEAALINGCLNEVYDYCLANPRAINIAGCESMRFRDAVSFRLLNAHQDAAKAKAASQIDLEVTEALHSFSVDPATRWEALRLYEEGIAPASIADSDVTRPLGVVTQVLLAIHELEIGWHVAQPFQFGGRERLKELMINFQQYFDWRLRSPASAGDQLDKGADQRRQAAADQTIFVRRGRETFLRLEQWLDKVASEFKKNQQKLDTASEPAHMDLADTEPAEAVERSEDKSSAGEKQ